MKRIVPYRRIFRIILLVEQFWQFSGRSLSYSFQQPAAPHPHGFGWVLDPSMDRDKLSTATLAAPSKLCCHGHHNSPFLPCFVSVARDPVSSGNSKKKTKKRIVAGDCKLSPA